MADRMTRFVARDLGHDYVLEDLECDRYHSARVLARLRNNSHNHVVLEFVAASANAFHDAAKMQQFDPLALAQSLDLSALIVAAEEARRVLEADTNTVAGVADRETFTKQVLLNLQDALTTLPPRKKLPKVESYAPPTPRPPRNNVKERVQARAQEH